MLWLSSYGGMKRECRAFWGYTLISWSCALVYKQMHVNGEGSLRSLPGMKGVDYLPVKFPKWQIGNQSTFLLTGLLPDSPVKMLLKLTDVAGGPKQALCSLSMSPSPKSQWYPPAWRERTSESPRDKRGESRDGDLSGQWGLWVQAVRASHVLGDKWGVYSSFSWYI